jgi:uncharacterized membrane protein
MKLTVRQIVVAGVMSAIAVFLGATRLGFIPFVLGTAITIMHVPVIIGAVLEGPVVGTIIGALFGIFSLVWAFVAPTGPGDLYFQNPLISILPRLFIGLTTWASYTAFRRASVSWGLILSGTMLGLAGAFCFQISQENVPLALLIGGIVLGVISAFLYQTCQQEAEVTALAVAAIVGTLTNTVLVLSAIGLLSQLGMVTPPVSWSVLLGVGVTNGIPEIVVAVLITTSVVLAWKQIETGRKGSQV